MKIRDRFALTALATGDVGGSLFALGDHNLFGQDDGHFFAVSIVIIGIGLAAWATGAALFRLHALAAEMLFINAMWWVFVGAQLGVSSGGIESAQLTTGMVLIKIAASVATFGLWFDFRRRR